MVAAFCWPCPLQFCRAVHCNIIVRSFKRKMCSSCCIFDKNYFNNLNQTIVTLVKAKLNGVHYLILPSVRIFNNNFLVHRSK